MRNNRKLWQNWTRVNCDTRFCANDPVLAKNMLHNFSSKYISSMENPSLVSEFTFKYDYLV